MAVKGSYIAAVDVGTNSFHLVVASVNNRGMMNIVESEKEVVRLGSGGRDMKYIQHDAADRGIKALRNFADLAGNQNAEIRAVATSAVREALNADEFVKRVKEESGIDIEVVSGAEEGRLIYIGVIHALPVINQKVLVVDIGGGSTETIVGKSGNIDFVHSEKLGAIRMTKEFFPDDGITKKQVAACREYISGQWGPTMKRLREIKSDICVGTSGTIRNLATMALAARGDRLPEIMNGTEVKADEILDIIDKLVKAKTVKQRKQIPGLDFARADIIVGGALIFENVLRELKIKKVLISTYALREGVVFDTVQKNRDIDEYRHLSHLRYQTVHSLCSKYHVEMKHAQLIKKISLELFNDLQSIHKLGIKYRELLEAAALLHDVGYVISHDKHHKHSYYIIKNSMMPGYTNDESDLIAHIARYHRKSHPKKSHIGFHDLAPKKQRIVKILSGILRIAEGVDRRQQQVVESVRAVISGNKVTIKMRKGDFGGEPDNELWGACQRKHLLEEALDININFELDE
ncbi:MAG: Ppx/GppA phosphatase family protein [Candidatus Kapabacteria bacterium]|jgi:exopolyphosphatase/guanosine-5'-triphosphate,3'-diphosphate pyrophosphatase|nr:Ppx/GppA phosphatase family protein [Candidatus Kapabacteria bacterium]